MYVQVVHSSRTNDKTKNGASLRCTPLLFMNKNNIIEHWQTYHSEQKKKDMKLDRVKSKKKEGEMKKKRLKNIFQKKLFKKMITEKTII